MPPEPLRVPPGRPPLDEYNDRLAARRETHQKWMRLDEGLSYARLAVVVVAALAGLALWVRVLPFWWLGLPALVFMTLVMRHDQVIRAKDARAMSITFYERGVARIEDRWMGEGEPGFRFLDDHDHPYSHDLDLFGRGSLFELLSIARARAGEDTLAGWLTQAVAVTEIRGRQEAVEELRGRLNLRDEHPADPFPELLEEGPARFDGTALGHPLIPASTMVRNDLRLTPDTRLLVVSGSNMSGKSTLLRTVGVNGVLALAGAPVRAERLVLTPLAVGATLRIQDSLQAGRSRFYAEITKIRQLTDLANGPTPLLFLLDELFQGTNSHDRLIGAIGVLGSLLDRGAIGLITTHDLALTAITDAVGGGALNVHFDDRFEGSDLAFDYRMRPGPVTRSNGLALMRAVGLDVRE